VLVGERELRCPARRCDGISRCSRPCDFHPLRSCIYDLVPKAVRRRLWVSLLREGGAAGPSGAAGPEPFCHSLRIMFLCVDEVLDPYVGCSLVCGTMDPSEANLDLWIELTLFFRSGSFADVFP
jgi:hypothetical protein